MNYFEEMKKQIQEKAKSAEHVGEIFDQFGVTPDNPEAISQMLKDYGLGDVDPAEAAEMVQNMMNSFSPEMRRQMAALVMEISKSIPAGPMPEEIKQMLEDWQKE